MKQAMPVARRRHGVKGWSEELDAQPMPDANRAKETSFIEIDVALAAHQQAVSFDSRCCVMQSRSAALWQTDLFIQ